MLLQSPGAHHPLHSVMVLTRLEVFLLGHVAAVVGPGSRCLGFTALLLVSKVLLLDLLLQMLLVSGVRALLLLQLLLLVLLMLCLWLLLMCLLLVMRLLVL